MTGFLIGASLILIFRFAAAPVVLPMADFRACLSAARAYMPVNSGSRLLVEASCIDHATGGIVVVRPDIVALP